MNPYEILELNPGASAEDVKAAYHRLAKQWHPDRFTGAEKEAAENRFRQLAEAFNMLKDAGRREEAARNIPAAADAAKADVQIQLDSASRTVPLHERTAADWYAEAKESFESGDPEKALGLVQYCIRLESGNAEYHVFMAKVLDEAGGDKKALVKALETAIRLNPKNVDSIIRLAEVFQSVGMYARATKLWERARNLAPNHRHFMAEQKKASSKAKSAAKPQGLGEQFEALKDQWAAMISRVFKRG